MQKWKSISIAAALLFVAMSSASMGQDAAGAGDGITPALVAKELEAMGFPAKIDKDGVGDPWIMTTVDGFRWAVIFFDCGSGALEQRNCASFQFYSGYSVPNSFPTETTNKWDADQRYAKAYTYIQRNKNKSARIEVDVLIAGTATDPAKTFRAYFTKMKNAAVNFRKAIGCSNKCTQEKSDGIAN